MYIHVFFLAGLFAAIRRKYALPVGLVLAHTRTAASRGRLCARPQMGPARIRRPPRLYTQPREQINTEHLAGDFIRQGGMMCRCI